MQILVHRQGQQLGPFSVEQLRAALAAGTISAQDLAWWDGAPSWTAVSNVPGIGGPPVAQGARPSDGSGLAVSSLLLGILSLIGCAFLAGIPAVICGHLSLGRKNRAGVSSGKGMAITGLVLGYIGTIMTSIIVLLAIIAVPNLVYARQRAQATVSMNHGRELYLACKMYASSHDGRFPTTLDDLGTEFLADKSARRDILAPEFGDDGFRYFGGSESDPPDKVLMVGKGQTKRGERVVVRTDGSVNLQRYSLPADL